MRVASHRLGGLINHADIGRDRLLGIEVKATTNPGLGDTRGLRLFRQEYPDRFAGGLLLHGGRDTQWMAEGVLAVPWWRVL